MKIMKVIEKPRRGKFHVFAVCSDRGDCELLDYLNGLDPSLQASCDKLLAILERAAEHGTARIPSEKCHTIADEIFQLTGGDLRVAWFYDQGRMIVCSHAYLKKGQKTKAADKKKALRAKADYFDAKANGNIETIE